ncbi:hypothetical protein ACVWWJ_000406 [Luteibacter sp. HA06]
MARGLGVGHTNPGLKIGPLLKAGGVASALRDLRINRDQRFEPQYEAARANVLIEQDEFRTWKDKRRGPASRASGLDGLGPAHLRAESYIDIVQFLIVLSVSRLTNWEVT